ncbi:FAD/NAD(P)-binding domain-containing protein [Zopfia rhizophila CBS 207.26]|uniref:FAD/NAD(P)-binding domain-containing protein n=1 Tax=Zopfia rhizophila CBS 207.26 TaxID=1314779 RepID=A0A6A6E322_9PEZI|nr:FAD/NAD(P)-binding domain-containing protein [Zopfia rhizophila CBS 207.26]
MASSEDINVIVVGAGFGGLASAIELTKKGCRVRVFESSKDLTRQGDVIMVGSNATRILSKWGNVMDELWKMASQPESMKIQDKNGKVLLDQPLPKDFGGFPNIYTSRTRLQNLLYECAISLGIHFTFNALIADYFEDESSAGIFFGGEKYVANFVIVADGVHSKGRAFVTGSGDKAKKSGFAVYRSWFGLENLRSHPLTRSIAESDKDQFAIWIAEDTHTILTTNVRLQSCTCFATHKDSSDIEESWHLEGKVGDMLNVVEGWDPVLRQLVKSIPDDCLIDHKLLWRDPIKQWFSPKCRIALVGDAAHPHLATSGTGGAQAIEDGATLGALIDSGGREGIPTALRVFQRLRYERTSLTQRMGWETRHRWHQTDWDAVAANPEFLKLPQPEWLNGHDAEQYAYDNFDAVVSHLEKGTPFRSTSVPDGYVHEDWTIETMMAREGQKAENGFYQVDNK